jgi:predicted kinase
VAPWSLRTYAELGRAAARELSRSQGVIVDATFRRLGDRAAFMDAFGAPATALFIECRAPRAVLAQRARIRSRDPGRVSDADESIVMREERSWESLKEVPAEAHLTLRTDRPVERIVEDLMALLDGRLRELASSTYPVLSGHQ